MRASLARRISASIAGLATAVALAIVALPAQSADAAAVTGGTCNAFGASPAGFRGYPAAKALGAAWTAKSVSVPACGPMPRDHGQTGPAVRPYSGAVATTEGYQCVEYSERFLHYEFGLDAKTGGVNGQHVVDAYYSLVQGPGRHEEHGRNGGDRTADRRRGQLLEIERLRERERCGPHGCRAVDEHQREDRQRHRGDHPAELQERADRHRDHEHQGLEVRLQPRVRLHEQRPLPVRGVAARRQGAHHDADPDHHGHARRRPDVDRIGRLVDARAGRTDLPVERERRRDLRRDRRHVHADGCAGRHARHGHRHGRQERLPHHLGREREHERPWRHRSSTSRTRA